MQLKTGEIDDLIPQKHWISARAKMLSLYCYLLKGDMTQLAEQGEKFLHRRKRYVANKYDVFAIICSCLVDFSKGESNKTRSEYLKALAYFIKDAEKQALFRFEIDLALIVLHSFPWYYSYEKNSELLRKEEQLKVFSNLSKYGSIFFSNSGISSFIKSVNLDFRGRLDLFRNSKRAIDQNKENKLQLNIDPFLLGLGCNTHSVCFRIFSVHNFLL